MEYKDFTIKARIKDEKFVTTKLISLGAKFIGTDLQTDTYFKVANGKLKWRQGSIENLITHYERILDSGIEKTSVYKYDVNPDQKEIDDLIRSHEKIGVIKKERSIFKLDNIKIHLDKFEGEKFIEIEAIDRENEFSDEDLKMQCLNIQSKLEISDKELMKTGYFAN